MDFFISDTFKLVTVLIAIIVIVALFLWFGNDKVHSKIHTYYISGISVFIIIELITYICMSSSYSSDIVSYISFAATISSLFLSVVAIIYAIVSNNKGEVQYQKIDNASDRIAISVDKFSKISDEMSDDIYTIISKLEEIKTISSETKNVVSANSRTNPNTLTGTIDADTLIDGYIQYGSYLGNLSLLACAYSFNTKKPFSINNLFKDNASYCYAYIMASTALGVVHAFINNDIVSVQNMLDIQSKVEIFFNGVIKNITEEEFKNEITSEFNNLKTYFNIQD